MTTIPLPHTSPPAQDAPTQLRRRRDASNRCEPLKTGYRDPLDAPAAVTAGRPYKPAAIVVDDRVILVRGYVRDTLRSAGLRPIWSGSGRGWLLDVHKMPDATALLEDAGFHVTVRERGDA